MRRETVGSSAHSAKMGSSSRATTRKVKHNTVLPTADIDAGRNDSPKGVPIVQPYGFAYWPAKQDEDEEQQGGQQKQSSSSSGGGGGPGDAAGAGAFEDDDQPKGKSAIGLTSYANGSRSDPSLQNLQDPRHQLMLENEDGEGKEDHGGREGDTAMYHQADKNIQLHFAGGDEKSGLKPGAYLSTDAKKNKIRLQLVKVDDDSQQSQQQNVRGSGPTSGGGKAKKKEGQRPLIKKESTTFIDIDGGGNTIHIRHGACNVKLTGNRVVGYYDDETKSFQVDENHTHIRCKDFRIWVDKEGCWSTVPVLVKQDEMDKS